MNMDMVPNWGGNGEEVSIVKQSNREPVLLVGSSTNSPPFNIMCPQTNNPTVAKGMKPK
jgi:hypothetical protein